MFKRQTTGSVVCSSCGSLVGVRDEKCYNCGRRNPGLWGFAPLLRSLGNDLGFVPLVVWLSLQPSFHLDQVWWLSVTTLWFQAGLSYLLLRQQFKRRLVDAPRPVTPAVAPAQS